MRINDSKGEVLTIVVVALIVSHEERLDGDCMEVALW